MSVFLYTIFSFLLRTSIRIASIWNKKAARWVKGRRNIFEELSNKLSGEQTPITWIHCSSLGEFEQGRPVVENIRQRFPGSKLLLTFFSPSGYEIRKDYKGADWVFYLPADSKQNARRFFDIVKPSLVIFIKYDFWYCYLTECKKRNIPLLLVSAIFRKSQPFFKWYGKLHKKMLHCFTHFFVQDENSKYLLASININNVTVSGDTRFDRVLEIAENFQPIELVEKFCKDVNVFVAGSTWLTDEKIISEAIQSIPKLKLIIAPHEIDKDHLLQIKQLFPGAQFYSELSTDDKETTISDILIIDNIGMLSRLYHYATITYVGGGFNKGIHNTLEAAVHGKPVFFGPNYKKFKEAVGLIENEGGISIKNSVELSSVIKNLFSDYHEMKRRSDKAAEFVQQHKGATLKVINYIEINRLLTN